MSLDTETDIREIREALDKDDNSAHAATDERLEQVRQQGENQPGLQCFKYTTSGTTAEQLTPYDVPDGVDVVVTYYPSNSGTVWVGDENDQEIPLTGTGQALTLSVKSTDAIWVQTPTANDSVAVVFET